MTNPSTEIFSRNWRIYQLITLNNYMFHDDFAKFLSNTFQKFSKTTELNVLDCGCGDAYLLSNQLQGLPVSSFTGYDMSEQALIAAKSNLSSLKCDVYLKQGFMQESILSESNNFDFIYSSFAIHHLQNEEKKSFLHQIFLKLKPGGTLVVIDILKTKNQTRENYLDEYIEHISLTWNQIENDDKELIFDHMRNFDFPTSLEMFKTWLQEIGFILVEQYEPDSRNSLLIAQKPS